MKAVGILLKLAATLALAVTLAGALMWMLAKSALPALDGERAVAGLAGPVTIARDAHGIPLITAQSEDDAYFALGYVHAQDRLLQMELMRRQGQGRLSELIGIHGLGVDKFFRTLGLYKRAEEDFRGLDADTQRAFERYAAGVNVWLAEGHALPLEFRILFIKPEPWKPADSLVWQKLMGLQLSGNWDNELSQAALIAKLGPEKAAALTPDPKPSDPVTMSQHTGLFSGLALAALRDAMTSVMQPTSASNAWVIDGAHTQTGKPILANDPHLGFQSPIIWYFASIETPTLKLFGATVPGVPLHLMAHNDRVAWGITTPESDTSDLFIEQLGTDGNTYETPEGPKAFESRTEIINVRFSDPVAVTVRETRHGPVVSDILDGDETAGFAAGRRVLALSSALLQPGDRTAQGVYRMNHAANAASFVEALQFFHAPQQNMMFADVDGGTGYYAPGRVPIRKAGDGTVPVPGWTGDYDWTGMIPFEALPHEIAPTGVSDAPDSIDGDLPPPSGILINANNKMVRDDYPFLIAAHWNAFYRAARLEELLRTGTPASIASTEAAQQDVVSLMARQMLPLLLARITPQTERHTALLDMLKAWDGTMGRDRPEPLIFAVWMEKLKGRILQDDLAELFGRFGGMRPEVMERVLTVDNAWCDDLRTAQTETCEQQVAGSWSDTMVWLDENGIKDASAVQWGDYHRATFGHILFQNFPGVGKLGQLALASSGDNYTVNRGSFSPSTARVPFRHNHGAGMRAVYDLSDLGRSQFAMAGGQSAHMASPYYGDLLESWRDGLYFQAPTASGAAHRLNLRPSSP